ncbi:phage terminase small subunit [Methylomarinovum tepidoasis]|uniref:Phage terminase small subunit n=2 Tax=Methylomarinovum tepidoasis TaxID=2840183 RepID=A0AAU9CGP6_9GAMM|nr:phage terminase small subunit [Methylomarinovum sp. IN45]
MTMKLTPKQERFCLEYVKTGNASEAYRCAYDADRMKPEAVHVAACRLLEKAKVALRIDELRQAIEEEAIADAKARQRWWTQIMYDETAELKDRLKASELLAKAQGDFIERREVSGQGGGPVILKIGDKDIDPEALGW